MQNLLNKLPLPICGLILGMASYGNLLQDYHLPILGYTFGITGIVLMLIVLAKLLLKPQKAREELKNHVVASVFLTFTMALMVICTYLVKLPLFSEWIRYVWLVVLILHIGLMGYFTIFFVILKKVTWQDVLPSWFITYVGIGVGAVTAGKFFAALGPVLFYTAFIFYVIVLPIVLYRMYVIKDFRNDLKPFMTILAAPGSLCLTGFMKVFPQPNLGFVLGLFVASQFFYLLALMKTFRNIRLPFYPSFGAFTFPLVITAMACSGVAKLFPAIGFLNFLAIAETILAGLVVVYVFFRYSYLIYSLFKDDSTS